MKHVNFDEQFQAYMAEWVTQNADRFGNNIDRMEAEMPQVYEQWLNTPADWLDGATPGTYFQQFEDAEMLVGWMLSYFAAHVSVPDQLLERIVDLGDRGEGELHALLRSESAPEEARLTAITLLSEMQSTLPLGSYVAWIAARAERDERADMAAEALVGMGRQVVEPIFAALDGATPPGRETFADVLCNFPGEERIYALTAAMFAEHPQKRALYASLLGKLGDERAIPLLIDAMQDASLNYLDFIELRNAVEALGGEASVERSFDGDPYYESLRRMQ